MNTPFATSASASFGGNGKLFVAMVVSLSLGLALGYSIKTQVKEELVVEECIGDVTAAIEGVGKKAKNKKKKKSQQESGEENEENEETLAPSISSHDHCKLKIQAERLGRINAEKMLREQVVEKIISSEEGGGYPLLVIGKCVSPFRQRRGAPRQGLLVPNSRSLIQLDKKAIPREMLDGLEEGYSHMFIQFLFHENTNLVKSLLSSTNPPSSTSTNNLDKTPNGDTSIENGEIKDENPTASSSDQLRKRVLAAKSGSTFSRRVSAFAARVLPPLLNGGSLGVFATRSPHRPNALGLSLVKILHVDLEERTILVSGADLVDGTPIVDIKPYGPFDCPTCLHHVVDHEGIVGCDITKNENRQGHDPDLEKRCKMFKARIPDWVLHGLKKPYKLRVEWSEKANLELGSLLTSTKKSLFYSSNDIYELKSAINQMLGLDIRSVHRGRGSGPSVDMDSIPPSIIQGSMNSLVSTDLIGDKMKAMPSTGAKQQQNYTVDYDIFHLDFTIQKELGEEGEVWICIDTVVISDGVSVEVTD